MDVITEILDMVPEFIQLLALLVTAGSFAANMTPAERDDTFWARLADFVDYLALNVFRPRQLRKMARLEAKARKYTTYRETAR